MRLYLVQHAEAVSEEISQNRPLTEQGKQQAKKMAAFLKAAQVEVYTLLSSPKLRATETAKIFSILLREGGLMQQRQNLKPNDPVVDMLNEMEFEEEDIMVVGHLPFLQKLAGLALTGKEESTAVSFKPAGVVCLERTSPGLWQLQFALSPELLKFK